MTTTPDASPVRPDLVTRAQVHELVVSFYREVDFDTLLWHVFDEVAEVDWSLHIPRLVDYWCRVLLGQPGYSGFLLGSHQRVHDLEAFRPELFDRWYSLWVETIDDQWHGPMAERAKSHAALIARNLARRLLDVHWEPPASAPPAPAADQSSA